MKNLTQRQQLIIFSIWFNSFWFSCVFATSIIQWPILAIGIFLYALAKPDYKLTLLALALGLIADFALFNFGIHQFINEQFPAWLLMLWLGLSLYIGAIHKPLRALNPLLLIAVISLLAPMSYAYGTTIGKIHWPLGIGLSYMVMLCTWLAYGCSLFTLRYYISSRWYRSVIVVASTIGVLLWPHSIAANANDSKSEIKAATNIQNPNNSSTIPWFNWPMVGQAQLEWLFWDVYNSILYTPSGQYQTNQPLALAIAYKLDIDKKDLIEATDEQWQHLNISKDLRQQWLAKLDVIWPDISEGDNLTFVLKNNYGSFYFNDAFIGQIDDAQLANAFVDIWLSKQTKYPKLRKKLINIKE